MSGADPFFGDVVRGQCCFEAHSSGQAVGMQTVRKIISALTMFAYTQQDLLGLPKDSIRDSEAIKNFERNVTAAEVEMKRR